MLNFISQGNANKTGSLIGENDDGQCWAKYPSSPPSKELQELLDFSGN